MILNQIETNLMANDPFRESSILLSAPQKTGPPSETREELTSGALIPLEPHPKNTDKEIGISTFQPWMLTYSKTVAMIRLPFRR